MAQEQESASGGVTVSAGNSKSWLLPDNIVSDDGAYSSAAWISTYTDGTDYLEATINDFSTSITGDSMSGYARIFSTADVSETGTMYFYNGSSWCSGHGLSPITITETTFTEVCSHWTWTTAAADALKIRIRFSSIGATTTYRCDRIYAGLNYTTSTVPGTPADPSITADGVGDLTVSSATPSDGGETITNVEHQISTSSTFASGITTWTKGSAPTNPQTHQFTELGNGSLRYARARYYNSIGWGSYNASPYNSATTWTVASAPTWADTKFTARTASSVTFDWVTPSSNGGTAITEYWYQWKIDGGAYDTVDTNSTSTIATKSSLSSGRKYWFKVLARNAVGSSSYTSEESHYTLCATPTISSVTDTGVEELTVSWSTVTGVSHWELEKSPNGTDTWTTVDLNIPSGTLTKVVGSLGDFATWYFRLRATNIESNDSLNSANDSERTWGVPSVPFNMGQPQAIAVGTLQLTQSTPLPPDNGTPITNWNIYSSNDGYIAVAGTAPIGTTTINISGLGNSTTRNYKINYINLVGIGSVSGASLDGTTFGVPDTKDPFQTTTPYYSMIQVQRDGILPDAGDGTPADAIDYWRIYRSSTSGGVYTDVSGQVAIASDIWNDTSLTYNDTWYYKLKYENLAGESILSTNYVSDTVTKGLGLEENSISDSAIFREGYITIQPLSDSRILRSEFDTETAISDSRILRLEYDTKTKLSDSRIKIPDNEIEFTLDPLTNTDFETGSHGTTPPAEWDAGTGSQDNGALFIHTGLLGVRLSIGSNPYSGAYIEQTVNIPVIYFNSMTLWLRSYTLTQQITFTYSDGTTTVINYGAVGANFVQKTVLNTDLEFEKVIRNIKIESIGSESSNTAALDDIVLSVLGVSGDYLSDSRILRSEFDTKLIISDSRILRLEIDSKSAISDSAVYREGYDIMYAASNTAVHRIAYDIKQPISDSAVYRAAYDTKNIISDSRIKRLEFDTIQPLSVSAIYRESYDTKIKTSDSAIYREGYITIEPLSESRILRSAFDTITKLSDSTTQKIGEISRVSSTVIFRSGLQTTIISDSTIHREGYDIKQILSIADIQRTFEINTNTISYIKNIYEASILVNSAIFHPSYGDIQLSSNERIVKEGTIVAPPVYTDSRILTTLKFIITSDSFIVWGQQLDTVSDATIYRDGGYTTIDIISQSAIYRDNYYDIQKLSDSAVYRDDMTVSELSDTRIFRLGGPTYPFQQQLIPTDTRIQITVQKNISSLSRIKLLDNEFTKTSDTVVIWNIDITKSSNTRILVSAFKKLAYSYSKITGVQSILKLSDTVIKKYGVETIALSDTHIHKEPIHNIFSDTYIISSYETTIKLSDTLIIHRGTDLTIVSISTIFNTGYGDIEKESRVVIRNLNHLITYNSDTSIKITVTKETLSDTSIRRDRSNIRVIFQKGRQL